MEDLSVDGIFWIADKPDIQVAGKLTFDSKNGPELDLIGILVEPAEFHNDQSNPIQVHGVAGTRLITLVNCMWLNRTAQLPGFNRERYRAEMLFMGAHIDVSRELEFDSVHLMLSHLDEWVGKRIIKSDWVHDTTTGQTEQITITYTQPPQIVQAADFGVVELRYMPKMTPLTYPVTLEATVTQQCVVDLCFNEKQPLDDLLRVCSDLQNLVSLGINSTAYIKRIGLSCSLPEDAPAERPDCEDIELYMRLRGRESSDDDSIIHPMDMLFTYDDIGGLDGVSKWLTISDKFNSVINLMLSHFYIPVIYTENQFMNALVAAESFERIKQQKRNINLKDSLKAMANSVEGAFGTLVTDIDSWAGEIVRVRINSVVHPGLQPRATGWRMRWLAESLYFLVVLCLLRECGMPEEVLMKVQQHRRFKHVAEQIEATQ